MNANEAAAISRQNQHLTPESQEYAAVLATIAAAAGKGLREVHVVHLSRNVAVRLHEAGYRVIRNSGDSGDYKSAACSTITW